MLTSPRCMPMRDRLLAICRPKFRAHGVKMELHGSLADLELVRNIIGGEPMRNHPQHLLFSTGQAARL